MIMVIWFNDKMIIMTMMIMMIIMRIIKIIIVIHQVTGLRYPHVLARGQKILFLTSRCEGLEFLNQSSLKQHLKVGSSFSLFWHAHGLFSGLTILLEKYLKIWMMMVSFCFPIVVYGVLMFSVSFPMVFLWSSHAFLMVFLRLSLYTMHPALGKSAPEIINFLIWGLLSIFWHVFTCFSLFSPWIS